MCLIDFLMYANCQKILLSKWIHSKLISTLKFLSNHGSIKTPEFTKTDSYFCSFTCEKTYFIAVSSSYQWICWQIDKLWIQHQNILCVLQIQTRLLFFLLHKIQMSKQNRLINLTMS